jgi:uncharacterized membrane protein
LQKLLADQFVLARLWADLKQLTPWMRHFFSVQRSFSERQSDH